MPLDQLSLDPRLPLTSGNSRAYQRYAYPHRQRVAYDAGKSPLSQLEFFDVLFHDISREGFSFYTDAMPAGNQVVAELGRGPQTIYVRGKIQHVTPAVRNDEATIVVGCLFTGRL